MAASLSESRDAFGMKRSPPRQLGLAKFPWNVSRVSVAASSLDRAHAKEV